MDAIRKLVAEMRAEEQRLLHQRAAQAQGLSRTTIGIVGAGSLLALLLVSLAGVIVRRDFDRRRSAEAERDRFFNLATDLLCIAKSDGYFKRVNPAFTATLGWSEDEMLARPFLEFVHPDDHAATLAEVERLTARGEKTLHFVNHYRHKDGSWRTLAWSAVPQPGGLMFCTARDITELERARAAVARSERKLAVTLDSIGDAVLATDAQRRITRLNRVAEQLTGWSRAEAQDRPVEEVFRIINEQTRQPAVIPVDDVLATGAIHGLANHTALISRDGSERPIADSAAPIRDLDGQILGVVLVFRDVTREQQAEQAIRRLNESLEQRVQERTAALRASEEFQRSITDHSEDMIFVKDREARLVFMNPAGLRLAGLAREQLLGHTDAEIHGDTAQAALFLAADRRVMELRRTETAEEEFISATGQRRILLTTKTPRCDADGQVVGLIGIARDITSRKEAEARLRESEARFRAVAENLGDGLLLTDLADTVLDLNPQLMKLTGFTRAELVGQRAYEFLLNPEHVPEMLNHNAARQEGRTSVYEVTLRRKDGTTFDAEVTGAPLRAPAGDIFGTVGVIRDVTARKKAQHQALRSQRLESLGTLAGGVAHDLNNALAPIMMSMELLRFQYPGEAPMVDTIQGSVRRAADMVKQLLTFAKGAEGARVIIQPAHLLKEMLGIMKSTFPKSITFAASIDSDLPTVQGDATQLHQVLLNLCVNARDAMPQGGTLTLEAEGREVDAVYASSVPDAHAGRYLVLRVRDTGTGIPPTILDRIFDPFFTTKAPDKGTGLGLSTVLGIVRGHGGFMQVYSHPGQGSTFAVYLPAAAEGGVNEPETAAPAAFQGRGETILVVDDEPDIRTIERAVLQRLNFTPVTATDGADAIMQVAEHRTELRAIITDMHMPHMDGLAFVRAIRRTLPDIPIVVASGRLDELVADEFKTLGVTVRLDKPFTQGELEAALKTIFGKQSQPSPP